MISYSWSRNSTIFATDTKIISFQSLPVGWRFGEGLPASGLAASQAVTINALFAVAGFRQTNAFPSIAGGVRVTAYHDKTYLEFTIEPNGNIAFVHEENDEEIECKENISLADARTLILDFGVKLWASSVLSTHKTSITLEKKSKALPSKTQVTEAESPSLMKSVPLKLARLFVTTSPDFTRSPLPRSSGDYLRSLSPMAVSS